MQTKNQNNSRYSVLGGMPEAVCWTVGLLLLAFMEPGEGHLFSLCPVSWLWEAKCLGCGLGHSIAFLFRGEIVASWQAHPLGLPAVLLLGRRIVVLVTQSYKLYLHHYKL